MVYSLVKRFLDLLFILVFSPFILLLILVLSILVFFFLGYPIFFFQSRIGLKGREFYIIKFRTMLELRDQKGILLPDVNRLTKFGLFLRKSSLDEIPCLINVFKGDMSLVGPRPFISKYRKLYNSTQFKRHDVIPGITGWAQVNGRNAISWEEKFKLDIYYVEQQSFFLDLLILWKTFIKVIARKDINANDNTTMPEFMGSDNI
ncbi:MAG: sugar transferase [Chitinophagaceae bacterium]|jgi:sugar transferase EpsL|nr:sugar transferase [Chitinophagaceae bacterium]MCA6516405.1 sugar transferase [Chitinophagaceae bacterium]